MSAMNRNFRYLSREGLWPGFAVSGLEADADGVLRLESVPLLAAAGTHEFESLPTPTGATGVAADAEGNVYAVDRDAGTVVRLADCFGSDRRETIVRSSGDPAGIAVAPHRRSLYIAERSAGIVRVVDLESGRTSDSWNGLDQPTALAFDGTGALYAVEAGTGRVRKLSASGVEDGSFSVPAGIAAHDVAAITVDGETTLYVLDAAARKIHPLGADGLPAGAPFGDADLTAPLGLAATATRVYAGDNDRRRLLAFSRGPTHELIGEAVGYRGPVAGLALIPDGERLLLHTGSGVAVAELDQNGGRRANGSIWSTEPIQAGDRKRTWSRVKALAQAGGGGIQFFWAFGLNAPPAAPDSTDPFPATHWLAAPQDVLDFHVGEVENERFWLAARLESDGRTDPSLEQVRVEFDREGYIEHLPAIFREGPGAESLARFLTLFETFFEEGQEVIRRLPELFDPHAVPAEALDFLASWLAVEIDEDWSDDKRREAVATAYERYTRRGTPHGLKEELLRQTGVRAHIAEPLQGAQVWVLPRDADPCGCSGNADCGCGCTSGSSSLGWTTMLAPAEWQGTVAGVSATLDQSHLIAGEEIGSPLWRDLAHRFIVSVYRGESDCPGRRAEIEAVIAREKPAHTLHHVCMIEPRMRVGFQAVVGVDAVVGGQSPTRLDSGANELILGGPPAVRAGASRVGMETRL